MPTYGTHGVADLLATINNASVLEVGLDNVYDGIQETLAIHNAIVEDLVGTLVSQTTTERRMTYGGNDEMDMTEMDEWGTPEAQKVTAGANVEFPLRLFARGVQWNYTYFEERTPADMMGTLLGIRRADIKNLSAQLRTAFFRPTNYTFNDHLVDKTDLAVKALLNADTMPIPTLPNGTSYAISTHTHFLGFATLTAAGINSTIDTVREHFDTGRTVLFIPQSSATAIRALTGVNEFIPLSLPGIQYGSAITVGTAELTTVQDYNRQIGFFGPEATPVFVKPWMPANYILAFQEGVAPPIVRRISARSPESANLRMRYRGEIHPLICNVLERKFGFGVWNRAAAAVARTNNVTYVIPAIT